MATTSSNRLSGRKMIASNRKARHDYTILDTYEAGVVLTGTEVKSLRLGRASLVDGFATIDNGEVFLRNVHIPEYEQGSWTNHEPRRTRKLLLHRGPLELRLADRMRRFGGDPRLGLVDHALLARGRAAGWGEIASAG